MQNTIYTIQFSHHLVTDLHPVPKQQSRNLELMDFVNFVALPNKTKLPEKFKLLAKKGFMKKRKKRAFLPSGQPSFIN